MKDFPLNIIIPCYNPFPGWEKELVKNCLDFKVWYKEDFSLILVNDASSRNVSREHIDYLRQRIPHFYYHSYDTNRGKGYALRTGAGPVQEGYILYTDIDFPYEKESMLRILRALEEGSDIAVGTRDDMYYENIPKRRTLISKLLRWHFRVVFRLPITDTQCGLKAFNQKGKEIFMKTRIDRFLFDMEFIALASRRKNITMKPVAVKLRNDVQFSRMNARILLREAFNFFRIFYLTRFSS
jgi:glycosyltransferase involved in cell wall biosynthesis